MKAALIFLAALAASSLLVFAGTAGDAHNDAWRTIDFVDEFGERNDKGAASAAVGSIRPMSIPYGDITARLFVNCKRAWVRFSEAPNLIQGNAKDGYTLYVATLRVDGATKTWRVRQEWGSEDVRFVASHGEPSWGVVEDMETGSTFAISLPWYGEGKVAFSWSLRGSSEAIRQSCD